MTGRSLAATTVAVGVALSLETLDGVLGSNSFDGVLGGTLSSSSSTPLKGGVLGSDSVALPSSPFIRFPFTDSGSSSSSSSSSLDRFLCRWPSGELEEGGGTEADVVVDATEGESGVEEAEWSCSNEPSFRILFGGVLDRSDASDGSVAVVSENASESASNSRSDERRFLEGG
ncbi:hypothetical protein BD309DRAFT_286858 [Dichomitus squalens]|nr:hypothetical protein BD309DRAFT_286858 [Dichomitus squalens]